MMASAGIGFAIPIDYVKEFLNALQGDKLMIVFKLRIAMPG